MSLLRATVLLFLLTSSVLARTLPPADFDPNTIQDDNYLIDENANNNEDVIGVHTATDSFINDALSIVPTCAADYSGMSIEKKKGLISMNTAPIALCVNENGDFVASVRRDSGETVHMYDMCGWLKKQIEIPDDVLFSRGCAFTNGKLFYSDTDGKRILQLSSDGEYEKVFATGHKFECLTTRDNLLYSIVTTSELPEIIAYDINTESIKYRFSTVGKNFLAMTMAFDPEGILYVTTGKNVEKFTYNGEKKGTITYPQVELGIGILIDGESNVIIADSSGKVYVFDKNEKLIKTITGFKLPLSVAMGYNCNSMLVSDIGEPGGIYLL